ncbi:MAG: MtnX-like HAD-IB family phosphatase [candidate division Zixibacteria bacterium]|nr:MtnX-like HAD-IB family phosphatase [candidate division Zixibacteria bacterium]
MKTAVFCDFDGTVTRRDIGYHFFRHFSGGRNEELVPLWKSGQLSTRDCLTQEAALVQATPEDVYRFLDGFELNRGFLEFASLCRKSGVELIIASDGLDFYIKYVLERYKLSWLPLIANKGYLVDNSVTVEFPHVNQSCERCGSCKGERIREYRAQVGDCRIAFVGDGYSDVCAAKEADFVLAKKDLEQYCLKHNIGYMKYDDFFDVARFLVERGYFAAPGLK